jgi:predicted porin
MLNIFLIRALVLTLEKFAMKKTLIALATLAATTAFAQSTVTIDGGVRIGYGQTTAGLKGLQTTQGSGNTMNFKIVEDLGGGLKAMASTQFRWDATNGLNANQNAVTYTTAAPAAASTTVAAGGKVGSTADLFHLASVGLSGGFGTIQMGRIGFDGMWGYTGFGSTTAGAQLNPVAAGLNGATLSSGGGATEDNQYRYTSPAMAGFTVQLGGAFKDYTAAAKDSQQIRASYANGPITAVVSKERNALGNEGTDLAASYDFGVAKVNLISGTVDNSAGVKVVDALTLSATAPMGAFTLKAAMKNDKMDANNDVTALGVDYALSKRTVVEANTWKIKNNTANKDTAVWVGVRHSF